MTKEEEYIESLKKQLAELEAHKKKHYTKPKHGPLVPDPKPGKSSAYEDKDGDIQYLRGS